MVSFIDAALGYPTAIYTVLLCVVLFYWLLAIIGVLDFDSLGNGLHIDLHADGSLEDLGALASFVVAFGLNGVPFSIALGVLVTLAWTVCCMTGMWVLPLVPTDVLRIVAGTVMLPVSMAVALPFTALFLRPLRGLFVTHNAVSNASLVGKRCRVLSGHVSESFGQAEVTRRGAGLNINVRAHEPNPFVRGSMALIIEYDARSERYLIEPEP